MISNIMGCQEEEAGASGPTITLTSVNLSNVDGTVRIGLASNGDDIDLPDPSRPTGPTLDDMWSIMLKINLADWTFTDNVADTISISAGFVGSSSIADEYYGNKFSSAVASGLPRATGTAVGTGAVSSTYLGSYNAGAATELPPLNLNNGATTWLLACNPATTFDGSTSPNWAIDPSVRNQLFIDDFNADTIVWLPLSGGIISGLPSAGAQIDYTGISAITKLLNGAYPASPFLLVDEDIAVALAIDTIDIIPDTTMAGYVGSILGGTSNPFTVCVPGDLSASGTPQLRIIIGVEDSTGNSESLTLNFPINYV